MGKESLKLVLFYRINNLKIKTNKKKKRKIRKQIIQIRIPNYLSGYRNKIQVLQEKDG